MSRLQFPFTTGLPPASVDALQQFFQQISRRKEQAAAAKAETERIKAETQRGFGRAAVNIATGGIAGAISGGVGGAFAGAAGVDPNLFTKRQKNQFDLQNFGIGTEALDTQADAAFGQLFASDSRNLVADPTGDRQLGTPLGGQPGPLPSKDNFRGIFRQQLLQQRAQQQAEQQKRAQQQAAQQKQLQKAATEQRIQAWFPDPKLEYDPGTTKNMALLRQQVQESITSPDMTLPPDQRQAETKDLERQLAALRQMGTKKPEFNIETYVKENSFTQPDGTTFFTQPPNGPKLSISRARSKGKGDENPLTGGKAQAQALKDAQDIIFDPETGPDVDAATANQMVLELAMESIAQGQTFSDAIRGQRASRQAAANKRSVLQQRKMARARGGTRQAALGNLARNDPGGPPLPPDGFQSPLAVPGRTPRAQGAQGPPAPPQQGAQPQQAQKPPHPALAKIAPENINPKAIAIVQKAGGTSDPISMEELKRAGVNRSQFKKSLRVGQIYIKGGDAFVWDGKEMVPMEKPTEKAS